MVVSVVTISVSSGSADGNGNGNVSHNVIFGVLIAVMWWDVTQFRLVEFYRSLGETYWLQIQRRIVSRGRTNWSLFSQRTNSTKENFLYLLLAICLFGLSFDPESGGSLLLRNVSIFFTALQWSHNNMTVLLKLHLSCKSFIVPFFTCNVQN